jgi:hypothetical protein
LELGVPAFAIEGTGSYGAGLVRHLEGAGLSVYECERPRRQERRRGKNDFIDAALAFLEERRRMHPKVCRFVSEAFYEGRLGSIPACAERSTSAGVGVRWLDVAHEGNRVDSEEEAAAIASEIERLLGHTFRDGRVERPSVTRT